MFGRKIFCCTNLKCFFDEIMTFIFPWEILFKLNHLRSLDQGMQFKETTKMGNVNSTCSALQESTFCYRATPSRHKQHGSHLLRSPTWSVCVRWTSGSRTRPSPPVWWVVPNPPWWSAFWPKLIIPIITFFEQSLGETKAAECGLNNVYINSVVIKIVKDFLNRNL